MNGLGTRMFGWKWACIALFLLTALLFCGAHAFGVAAEKGSGNDGAAAFFASEDINMDALSTKAELSSKRIVRAKGFIGKMAQEELSTTRVRDTILVAENMWFVEVMNEQAGNEADYGPVNDKADNAIALSQSAFQAADELSVLKENLEKIGDMDIGPAWDIYNEGVSELENERYELALKRVEDGYEKLVELQSVEAKANAMYTVASKTTTNFLVENRFALAILFGTPLVLYIIFRDRIRRYRLTGKLNKLRLEVEVLEGQVKSAQEQYFVKGTMAESTYEVRTTTYGQMIRDLNREISVTKEEIEKTKRMKLHMLKKMFRKGETKAKK